MNRLLSLLSGTIAAGLLTASASAQDMPLQGLLVPGEGWQVVADGLGFADGPCADEAGNFYYSDMRAPAIYRVGLDGQRTRLAEEPASGLKFGPDGRLYACQGAKKRLIALDLASGQIEVIAENVQPNDLAISRAGHIYFTETGKKQVTWVEAKTRAVQAADTGITGPNGIALSPDQGTLVVSDSKGGHAYAFRVEADGRLTSKAPYITLRLAIDPNGEFARQSPPPYRSASGGDGMTTDAQGRYYITSAVGVQVFDPTGRLCGVLPKPQAEKPLTSCGLAGEKRGYLYVTNGDRIFRRKVQAEGVVWHR